MATTEKERRLWKWRISQTEQRQSTGVGERGDAGKYCTNETIVGRFCIVAPKA
jgi:hypothetical protein